MQEPGFILLASMTAVRSLSLKQFLAINHLLLFQELLSFVPCKGLGTLQLPKWGLTKIGQWQVAGCQEGGCQEPGADGKTVHSPAFLGSPLGESSRGLVQENGQHQRTLFEKVFFCTRANSMQVLCPGNLQLHSSDLQGPVSGEDHLHFHPFPCLSLASRLYLLPFLDFVCCAPISLSVNCEMG